MKHAIYISGIDDVFYCSEDDSILCGLLKTGSSGIPAGCRGGGCGICKIQILSGEIETRPMSSSHISRDDIAEGTVLACRAYPRSDIRLDVIGKLARRFKKAA